MLIIPLKLLSRTSRDLVILTLKLYFFLLLANLYETMLTLLLILNIRCFAAKNYLINSKAINSIE